MAITTLANSLKNVLNQANPNALADAFRVLGVGSFVRALPTTLRLKNMATAPANPYVGATLQALTLPDDAKANSIFRAFARTGTATATELAAQAYGTTPGTGQIAVAPNGDIVTLAADAWTNVDVVYLPEKCDAIELTLPVVPGTGVCALPAAVTALGVVAMFEAEALAGTLTGKKIILVPGSAAPATTLAKLDLAHSQAKFAVADAVTSCRVKLGIASSIDVDALLTAVSPGIL